MHYTQPINEGKIKVNPKSKRYHHLDNVSYVYAVWSSQV